MCTLAFSYTRMSTERQIKGDSLRRQLDWGAAFAERHGLVLDNSLRDIGVSAWKGKHRKKGALGEFLRMVEEGLIPRGSYLLIESLDRLSREQVMEALQLFLGILRQGIVIATMDPEQIYTPEGVNLEPTQLIIALTFMSRANEESERKSSRVRQAFRNKREMAAEGAKTNSAVPTWIDAVRVDRSTFRYELNERVHVVRSIFEMSASGMGVDAIARALNRQRIPTLRSGKRGWWPNSVAAVLTSRAALGELQQTEPTGEGRRKVGDALVGYYPAAVEPDLFLRAQKQPSPPRRYGRKGDGFTNLVGDLATCAHCGTRMYLRSSGRSKRDPRKTMYYLVCSKGSRDRDCEKGTTTFSYDAVEQQILDHVHEFGLSELLRAREGNQQLVAMDRQLASATVALDLARAREARLLEAIENDDGAAVGVLVGQLNKRVEERQQAETERNTLQHARDVMAVQQGTEDPTDLIRALREEWTQTDDITVRYRARSRCHAAMRGFVDDVVFDSVNNTFMVILKGGMRAYQFDNKKVGLPPVRAPRVVDMNFFRQHMWMPDNAALDELLKVPLTGKPVNASEL